MVLAVNGRSVKALTLIFLAMSSCLSVRVVAFSFTAPTALRSAGFANLPHLRRGDRAAGITSLRASSDKNSEVGISFFLLILDMTAVSNVVTMEWKILRELPETILRQGFVH